MAEESSRRVQRVEKQIREILATHLIREFQHHVDGLITISNVRISPDLKHGRIYLRVLGPTFAQSKIQQLELFDELKERHAEIQRFLGKSLDTKFIPKLEFFYDDSLEESLKVEATLKRLADERKANPVLDEGVASVVIPASFNRQGFEEDEDEDEDGTHPKGEHGDDPKGEHADDPKGEHGDDE